MPKITTIPVLFLSLLLCACGSFRREWREAVADRPVPPEDFTGPWSGTWHSEPTGHSGKLRAIISPAEGTEPGEAGTYDFHYHATWATILRASYRTRFEVTEDQPGEFRVDGSHRLGRRGSYRQQGSLTANKFDSSYDAGIDHGTMILRRPP